MTRPGLGFGFCLSLDVVSLFYLDARLLLSHGVFSYSKLFDVSASITVRPHFSIISLFSTFTDSEPDKELILVINGIKSQTLHIIYRAD